MIRSSRVWFLICGLCLASVMQSTCRADDGDIPTALQDYVHKLDDSFAWKILGKSDHLLGRIYDVELTSQTWQQITWKHVLMIYEPKVLRHRAHALLFITGGSHLNKPNEENRQMGLLLATMAGARVAMVHQVPNQPLFGNRVEDDLITETFLKFLETGDKSWPLLFPMVKSAVKTMDAVEQISKKEWDQPVKSFVVTGASKRGWTTWLSAVADQRIVGIAPIVIDTLNFQKQMDYQIETWGKYSEQIDDYTRKGLVKRMQDDPALPLWRWVDPHTYRSKLSLPKLIINGTNDRYWTVDALNNYWADLDGPKFIHYVPNAGHNLKGGPGSREAALATLAAFFEHVVLAKPLPVITWAHADTGKQHRLMITANVEPIAVKLWSTTSMTKDFRDAKWSSTPLTGEENSFVGEVAKPTEGHAALFGEVQFRMPTGTTYSLSTQLKRE